MSDGLFFVGILLFFFLLWFVSGGPTRPISFAGPYITPISDVNQSQQGYGTMPTSFGLPQQQFGGGSGSSNTSRGAGAASNQQVHQGLVSAESELRRLQGAAGDLKAFGEPSPLRGQVRISGVSSGTTIKDEYITLQVTSSAPGPITISGWRLRSSASGNSATIPYGTELPKTGINTTAPMTLAPGETAIIATGDSPIGVSFRENMCIGYFGARQTFTPSLWNTCPSPLNEFNRFYRGNKLNDDRCYTYVQSLQQCTEPVTLPSDLSGACETFVLDYLDYSGCVTAHRYDVEFKNPRYRLYLERSSKLWKSSREAIRLLDPSGKTVDLYTY